jgi:hypothetical protein
VSAGNQIPTGRAPSNGPQTKQQLKQTCDAIYTNYTQQFAMQKLKNSFQNVAAFGIGMLFGGEEIREIRGHDTYSPF